MFLGAASFYVPTILQFWYNSLPTLLSCPFFQRHLRQPSGQREVEWSLAEPVLHSRAFHSESLPPFSTVIQFQINGERTLASFFFFSLLFSFLPYLLSQQAGFLGWHGHHCRSSDADLSISCRRVWLFSVIWQHWNRAFQTWNPSKFSYAF